MLQDRRLIDFRGPDIDLQTVPSEAERRIALDFVALLIAHFPIGAHTGAGRSANDASNPYRFPIIWRSRGLGV